MNTHAHKKVIFKSIKFSIVVLFIALFYFLAKQFIFVSSAEMVSTDDLSYGLPYEDNFALLEGMLDDIKGYLYFDSISVLEAEDGAQIEVVRPYVYDLKERIALPKILEGVTFGLTPISSTVGVLVATVGKGEDQIANAPIWIDVQTREYGLLANVAEGQIAYGVTPHPNGKDSAVTLYRGDVDASDFLNLEHWSVIFHNNKIDTDITLYGVASAAWLNDGDDLVYLRQDGVYRYNLAADAEDRIFDVYRNFGAQSRITVSSQSDYAILTMPSLHAFALLAFTDAANGVVQEIGVVQTDDVVYTSSVFSPDGRYYAVTSKFDADERNNIEIRSVRSRDILDFIELDEDIAMNATLSAWSDTELPLLIPLEAAK